MTVGKTSDAELEKIIGEGGRRGEIYAGLKGLRDKYSDLVRQNYPNIPRRVSGYNLNYLLPENGFDVARALVGAEGTCVTVLQATCRLVQSPPARVLLLIAYRDILPVRRPRPGGAGPQTYRTRRHRRPAGRIHAAQRHQLRGPGAIARGRRLAAGGIRRRYRGCGRSAGDRLDGKAWQKP